MLFSGQTNKGGLFWVLFWAVAKEYLASGARPAMPENKSAVNAINRKKLYTTRRNLEVRKLETIQIVE